MRKTTDGNDLRSVLKNHSRRSPNNHQTNIQNNNTLNNEDNNNNNNNIEDNIEKIQQSEPILPVKPNRNLTPRSVRPH